MMSHQSMNSRSRVSTANATRSLLSLDTTQLSTYDKSCPGRHEILNHWDQQRAVTTLTTLCLLVPVAKPGSRDGAHKQREDLQLARRP